jgi:heme exporter protein D
MTHLGYIAAAYALTALVLLGMTAWVWLNHTSRLRKLRRLEDEGLRRRSEVRR